MKKVTEEHYIPERQYITTKFVACDGVEFSSESECIKYEAQLAIDNHPVMKSRICGVCTFEDGYPASLFYISSIEDVKFLQENLMRGEWHTNFDKYGAGWYLYWISDEDDWEDNIHLCNYKHYEQITELCFSAWKEKMRRLIPDELG